MELNFEKYQGAGNDFIMIDQRDKKYIQVTDTQLINTLCDRRFGIGADGLILLERDTKSDFKMVYFNADGRESSMCGNGGRCIVSFAHALGMVKNATYFDAIDGIHRAEVTSDGLVSLQMIDVSHIEVKDGNQYILNTGSPHYVVLIEDVPNDINEAGRKIRYSAPYKQEGINVNFVKVEGYDLHVATYERGVEGETLSCGTGVTGSALAFAVNNNLWGTHTINIQTKGGKLSVKFDRISDHIFQNIWLIGPATYVYKGTITI